jgi:hypothetical protein
MNEGASVQKRKCEAPRRVRTMREILSADLQSGAVEHFQKCCSHSGEWKLEAVFLSFGFVSAQSQGFSNLLLRQSLAKAQKSSLRIGYDIFSNALAKCVLLPAGSGGRRCRGRSQDAPSPPPSPRLLRTGRPLHLPRNRKSFNVENFQHGTTGKNLAATPSSAHLKKPPWPAVC